MSRSTVADVVAVAEVVGAQVHLVLPLDHAQKERERL